MADSPNDIAAELRKLAIGRVEWRVQDPVERCYCISFGSRDSINPEREAREWLADYKRRWPNGLHAHYEVAEVRYFTDLEQAALRAADALDAAGVKETDSTGCRWKPCTHPNCQCTKAHGVAIPLAGQRQEGGE